MDALHIWLLGFSAATVLAIAGVKLKCEHLLWPAFAAINAAGFITVSMKLIGDVHGITGWHWAGILIGAFVITSALNVLWWLWDQLWKR